MNSLGCLSLIKLLCFISTSAHTNYLIYLLKSVADPGQRLEKLVSSEVRILLNTPLKSTVLFENFQKIFKPPGWLRTEKRHLKSCYLSSAYFQFSRLSQWPFPVAVSSEEAYSTDGWIRVNREFVKKLQNCHIFFSWIEKKWLDRKAKPSLLVAGGWKEPSI